MSSSSSSFCCEWAKRRDGTTRLCVSCLTPLSITSHVHQPIEYDPHLKVRAYKLERDFGMCSQACVIGYIRVYCMDNYKLYYRLWANYLTTTSWEGPLPDFYPAFENQYAAYDTIAVLQESKNNPTSTVAKTTSTVKVDRREVEASFQKKRVWIAHSKLHHKKPSLCPMPTTTTTTTVPMTVSGIDAGSVSVDASKVGVPSDSLSM